MSGRKALVTGATGQLGRVIPRILVECGADVIIHYYINKDKANELAEEIQSMGRASLIVQADLTDQQSVAVMKLAIDGKQMQPDIVVANAVIQHGLTTIPKRWASMG